MEKEILGIIDDDNDTIVVDTESTVALAEAGADAVALNPAFRPASRGLYALLEAVAVTAGTVAALLCAVTFGVASLQEASGIPDEELGRGWEARFANYHAHYNIRAACRCGCRRAVRDDGQVQ